MNTRLISFLIIISSTPIIGLILWFYSLSFKGLMFYLLLPIALAVSLLAYLLLTLGLSIIVYKSGFQLKEGVFSVKSKEYSSWVISHLLMRQLWLVQLISYELASKLYERLFNSITGNPLIESGFVEHSLVNTGDNCVFGSNCEVLGHLIDDERIIIKRVIIGSNVVIGAKTIVMPGAVIGDNVIIGAMSLVPKDKRLKPNSVYAGIPVRFVRKL